MVRAAYLFGSHVEGVPDQWSDIDVAVFMEGVESWDIRQRATAMALVMEKVGLDVECICSPSRLWTTRRKAASRQYILRHGTRILS